MITKKKQTQKQYTPRPYYRKLSPLVVHVKTLTTVLQPLPVSISVRSTYDKGFQSAGHSAVNMASIARSDHGAKHDLRRIHIDPKNTSKESRLCVLQSIQNHPYTEIASKPSLADVVWIDRALPIKRFYLQRLANNRRVFQRTNRFYGMNQLLTKCSLTKSLNVFEKYSRARSRGTQPLSHMCTFLPRSFCLPSDESTIRSIIEKDDEDGAKDDWYIVKPDRGRCGRGMYLAQSLKAALDGWKQEETMDYGDPRLLKPVSKAYVSTFPFAYM